MPGVFKRQRRRQCCFPWDEMVMTEHSQVIESLRDTRHFARSQNKAADNAKFSEEMFSGRTASCSKTGHSKKILGRLHEEMTDSC
jgi:hypothetical protein